MRAGGGGSRITTNAAQGVFGDAAVYEERVSAYADFKYDRLPTRQVVETTQGTGAGVTVANGLVTLTSGTSLTGTCTIATRHLSVYRPGIGVTMRGSALFGSTAVGSFLLIGAGNAEGGAYFGSFSGAFGILHTYGGSLEIRTFTVTAGSSTTEDITITLSGAATTVAVASGDSAQAVARKISATNFGNAGPGWDVDVVGTVVYFISRRRDSYADTYSVTATDVTGTFAQVLAGSTGSSAFTLQSAWNRDPCDGTNKFTLDTTKLNNYQIRYGYGASQIEFGIQDPSDGYRVVHVIEWGNANTTPNLRNPFMSARVVAANDGGTTSASMSGASLSLLSEGDQTHLDPKSAADYAATSVGASGGTFTPVTSIKVNRVFANRPTRGTIRIVSVGASDESTKPVRFRLLVNATLTGDVWAATSSDSYVSQDTSATALTGGILIRSFSLGKSGQFNISLREADVILTNGDTLTLAYESGTGNPDLTATVSWEEDQ